MKEQVNICAYKQKHLLANLTDGWKSVFTHVEQATFTTPYPSKTDIHRNLLENYIA